MHRTEDECAAGLTDPTAELWATRPRNPTLSCDTLSTLFNQTVATAETVNDLTGRDCHTPTSRGSQ